MTQDSSTGVQRIAVDTLGADESAETLVSGALDAAKANTGGDSARFTFFGDARTIAPLLTGSGHDVVHSPQPARVSHPLRASLRGEVQSSMRSAIAALAAGRVDAVVSAGSTGALLALSGISLALCRACGGPPS